MKSGTMKLYDKYGELVNQSDYDNSYYRNRTLNKWRLTYGKKYQTFAIHYLPDEDERLVKKDGTNARERRTVKGKKQLLTFQ